jgi:hypothetical protein
MLGPGRYLLGVAEIALLIGFAWLGASGLRFRLLPRFEGAPARLATAVIASALLIWLAEILGTFSALKPVPYLIAMALIGSALSALAGGRHVRRWREGKPRPQAPSPMAPAGPDGATLLSLVVAAIAVIHFAAGVRLRLSTGMTGFDSTWYHGPFAAGFFQSGNTIDLHFIAPQFLAWFYPANGEIFHSVGMLAFGRDVLSPLLNLGWFAACLVACWCIGKPYRVAPWSLALGSIALSVPVLADQAGEARNDIVGIFFLLAAVAIALDAWRAGEEEEGGLSAGSIAVVGLGAGLAAGTKLDFLLPAAALILGLVAIAPRRERWRALAGTGLAALAGGGYWYLRNLVQAGNPLPWIHHLGPISLPAPQQALGGREAHSVLGYLADGTAWSDWFLPGLHHGLWLAWPLLGAAALAGLFLCLLTSPRLPGSSFLNDAGEEPRNRSRWLDPVLPLAGLAGLATALAWLVAPTSASGPEGMPRGFESGLRYLAPALVLGLALLPAAPPLRSRLGHPALGLPLLADGVNEAKRSRGILLGGRLVTALVLVAAIAVGYPVQRHYLQSRYSDPTFTAPGLNAAFEWAGEVADSRIATTSTRQYPLFGTDLSNHVQFVGEETPHGGFEAPSTCRTWRQALNAGDYNYVIATRDRIEKGKPLYPSQARWTEGRAAKPILRKPPTVVFQLKGALDPSACP